ncbi:hypothetical protein SNOG_03392 [Parastagonospora nodorum SN15]|uniref:Uncharacterized protein n=1 Tax=Phaeosphaeria nodorum (strain SN15 / ATCC MYA-4574 / FGSC 10173) TaxID=321614 RepID=Q0UXX2_PHANO|nr:hypothetical protein SNOG_03392 [Parastagonospora nodorum SN15]EAT88597.1 hypothetical protein SNOG_03392 [Parastagonospora nodorum SN15]
MPTDIIHIPRIAPFHPGAPVVLDEAPVLLHRFRLRRSQMRNAERLLMVPFRRQPGTIKNSSTTCLVEGRVVSLTSSCPFFPLSFFRSASWSLPVLDSRSPCDPPVPQSPFLWPPMEVRVLFRAASSSWPTPMEVRVLLHIPHTSLFFPATSDFWNSCRNISEFLHQCRWCFGRTRSHAWTSAVKLAITSFLETPVRCETWALLPPIIRNRRPRTPPTLSKCSVFTTVSATVSATVTDD